MSLKKAGGRRQGAGGAREMGIQTPTNCGHRVDGGVLNPMARRQIVQRSPNDREKPPAFCPLPSASQPKADNKYFKS